jgi:hypothetical protein
MTIKNRYRYGILFILAAYIVYFAISPLDKYKMVFENEVVVGLSSNSLLRNFGVKSGDRLKSINNIKIESYEKLIIELEKLPISSVLNVDFIKKDSSEILSIALPQRPAENNRFFTNKDIGFENPDFFVGCVKKGSLGSALQIKPNDRFLLIQGRPIADFKENKEPYQKTLDAIKTENRIQLSVIRGDQVVQLQLEKNQFDPDVLNTQNSNSQVSDLLKIFNFLQVLPLSETPVCIQNSFDCLKIKLSYWTKGWLCGYD